MAVARSQTAVDTVTWTAITAPTDSNMVYIVCRTSAILTRTNSTDATTQDTLAQNVQEIYGEAAPPGPHYESVRFPTGSVVVYVQAVSGTGPIIATGVR